MSGISMDVWRKAIDDAQQEAARQFTAENADALTLKELAAFLGCSVSAAERRAVLLVRMGKAEQVDKMVLTKSGAIRKAAAYRLKS